MKISKYSANGNDFIIFHSDIKKDRKKEAIKLCDRHNGIGADGMIVIVKNEDYDFEWEFYNSDGGSADMCGNGSRACAHYAYKNSLAPKKMSFLTGAGEIRASVEGDMVEVELTQPVKICEAFEEEGFKWYSYNTGVPHLVTIVGNLDKFNIEIAKKMRYRYNSNINFLMIKDDILYVRTYERGVEDETYACGTGMAACFFTAYELKKIAKISKVIPKSQDEVFFKIEKNRIFFKGEVKNTFTAILDKDES